MSKFWSAIVHQLTPYVPGEQPKTENLIKLNTNENPYGPSPKVLRALKSAADNGLRLYPDPNSDDLKVTLANHFALTPANVFVGNGSDEVLAHVFQALFKHEQPLLHPDITYSFYPVYCGLYGIEAKTIPLRDDFTIQVDDYLVPNGGIIFPNPNAPTGIPMPLSEITRLLDRNTESVVVIDEAYVDFGTESAVSLINQYPNLLVTQTLSKSRSLAGLRVGYALGAPALIDALNRVKDSFNSYPIDRLASAGAIASIEDKKYFEMTRQKVIETREKLIGDMATLGFESLLSGANFIFTKHHTISGADLTDKLRANNIIVRHFKKPSKIADYVRITIGIEEETDVLIRTVKEITG
jgi:histidinol-phosphate aminotransferase